VRLGGYEVLGELGEGGMAVVYRVRSSRGDVLALKVLKGNLKEGVYERFQREQDLLASLGAAEGFVPLVGSGVCEAGPFFVMPFVSGGTLRSRLERGPLSVEETRALGRDLGLAIGRAHERGIVHRDLKPENVLFDGQRRALISDLGIAKHIVELTSTSAEALTKAGALLGTLGYMAPEQLECAQGVTARADVFSLGAILYECLAGRSPFEGHSVGEKLVRTMDAHHVPLGEVRPDVPADLSSAIEASLHRNPAERPADGFAFAEVLGGGPRRETPPSTAAALPDPPRSGGSRVRSLVAISAIAMLGVLGLVLSMAISRDAASPRVSPKPAPPPPPPVAKGWFDEPMPPGLRKAAERPLYTFDTGRGLELRLVHVPSGDFMMGAVNGSQHEKPIHLHPMPRYYYIGRTEVTWGHYLAFCRATGHVEPSRPDWRITDEHPVVNVSWDDAQAFCQWAHVVLPSEAEWEKAARGTDWREWPWGNEWLPGRANILDASCPEPGPSGGKEPTSDGFAYTAPVGSFPEGASPYGALDMAGNAMEWCADWFDEGIYQEYSNGRTDPPATGTRRVERGGDWSNPRAVAKTTFRIGGYPNGAMRILGFRIVVHADSVRRVR